jgi:glutaredoxin
MQPVRLASNRAEVVVLFSRLLSWWRGRRSLPHLNCVLYTRAGCHLCETAHQELLQAQCRYGFRLETVDIDADPDLVAKYGEQVPVVTLNGEVRFRGQVNRVLLERLLRAESQRTK